MNKTQASAQTRLRVVEAPQKEEVSSGSALVMGHFPPLASSSSANAAAAVRLFEAAGYEVRSVTGPGLALATNAVNFTSETRFGSSTAFIDRLPGNGLAVIHARSLDFSRIVKPTWVKRRMEELRRMRLVARIVARHRKTALVLDGRGVLNRETLAIVCGAFFGALRGRRPVELVRRSLTADRTFARLTGQHVPMPDAFVAEEASYRAAFAGNGRQSVRLTAPRAEQIVRYRFGKDEIGASDALRDDVCFLANVAQRHDFRQLPVFKLLGNGSKPLGGGPGSSDHRAVVAATEPSECEAFGIPLNRYILHLRRVLGLEGRFPIRNRADARRLLNWYLVEASSQVTGNWLPVPTAIRDSFRRETPELPAVENSSSVLHVCGRDANPAPLSNALVAAYLVDGSLQERFDINDPVDRVAFAVLAVLSASDTTDVATKLGVGMASYLAAPVGGEVQNLSRFEFLIAMQARLELTGREEIQKPWSISAAGTWSSAVLGDRFPAAHPLLRGAHMPSRSAAAKLVGLPNSGTGVGSNLLMSKQALEDLGLNPKVVDIGGGSECVSRDLQGWKRRRELARPMVLHHLNADKIPQAMASFGTCNRGNQVNIGFLLWEFSVLPLEHRLALDMLDEIWVPSEFVRNTYSDAGARNVANVGKAIALPNVPKADLRRFGIPPGTTTFLTCFDFHSSVERKNPLAAVEGFLAAFSGRADVRLVVKTTPPTKNHWGDAAGQWSKIEALAARDPRLILMTERVPFADLIALIKGVDCLISPHRSEGFGLLPAYALASATPVIATDYSGTRDFCTDKTSLPVPYRLVPVGAKDALFQMKGAMWADIDRHALARVMRDFADDPMDGRMRAVRGRHLIGTKYAPKAHAARYRERLESLGVLSPETACERLA